jgi:hypothetical protein
LRCWVFEGSTNLLDWVVLREHSNDSSLANPFVWASWTILQENQVQASSRSTPHAAVISHRVFRVAAGA